MSLDFRVKRSRRSVALYSCLDDTAKVSDRISELLFIVQEHQVIRREKGLLNLLDQKGRRPERGKSLWQCIQIYFVTTQG